MWCLIISTASPSHTEPTIFCNTPNNLDIGVGVWDSHKKDEFYIQMLCNREGEDNVETETQGRL